MCVVQAAAAGQACTAGGAAAAHPPTNITPLAGLPLAQDAGDVDVALVKYRVAAAVTPRCPQLWNNIGMAFFAKQRYIAAIACLKRAQGYGPFEWVVAYNLGLLHLATQQPASAFNHLSAAVNLKPDFAHRCGGRGGHGMCAAQLACKACAM
jgi:Bardet-Biedl syndrome 4 protein